MAEPTLNLTLSLLEAKLGTYARWGRGANYSETAWTTLQQAIITDAIESGLRSFYYAFDWTFLKPVASLSLVSGTNTITLPDDFGGFAQTVNVVGSTGDSKPFLVQWRHEGQILDMISAQPDLTGYPRYAAEQKLKPTTLTTSQRSQMLVFPTPDQNYTLKVQYYFNPNAITSLLPYSLGGPQHIETILESCLSVMETRLGDQLGIHKIRFGELLEQSKNLDMRNRPKALGPNLDRSDEAAVYSQHDFMPACTYNGISLD